VKTVHNIFVEALALQKQGLTPRQVADKLLDLGHAAGFKIEEYGSRARGSIELVFPVEATIYFDGTDWHYLRHTSQRNTQTPI
jgi:hypothetical protein